MNLRDMMSIVRERDLSASFLITLKMSVMEVQDKQY